MTEDKITITLYQKKGEIEYIQAIRFPARLFIESLKRAKKNVLNKLRWEKDLTHICALPFKKIKPEPYKNA